ncbi:Phosphatidylinositol-specific phospholipase C, X domain [Parelaphostrongylus tenuis]|uniref:Phosphoinositide phospholipase C n=1 Tax=Parelaphostrongylus tenuis TaxID=148309 RepID=A0AAD5MKE9_PARTN|nr:Phosphatidylinositol-specific phospholipase C, X domain [Parelaphostrongylus tenuis]
MSDRNLVETILSMGEARGLKSVFEELCDIGKNSISRKKFLRMLQTFQRDPRLNESLYPPVSETAMEILLKKIDCPPGDDISFTTFVHYLWSDYCIDSPNITQDQVADTMHEPLPHYFINSSHNTYCSGLQVKGAQLFPSSSHKEAIADVEICVELDCWDGSDGPVVTHGPSAVMRMNEIPLKTVCLAIDQCAFKTSPYPVILSIENHLCQQQQKEMVQIFREVFGSKLLVDPLENHPLVEDHPLPSPHTLKYKILIKAKKVKSAKPQRKLQTSEDNAAETSVDSLDQMDATQKANDLLINAEELELLTEDVRRRQLCPLREQLTSSDLSRIVNYLTADKVPHTWNVERRLYLMCSLSEDASMKVYKDPAQRQANNLIKHTSKRLVRVFPSNMRITSDNFLPHLHWMMGVQIVALNFQTNSLELLVNHAMFEQTAQCGYVKKPDCLCDASLDFDIYSDEVPQRMPVTLKVKPVFYDVQGEDEKRNKFLKYWDPQSEENSDHFFTFLPTVDESPESPSYFVTVDLLDLPPYDRISGFRAFSINTSGVHTYFHPKQTLFEKIILSETAFLQIGVWRRSTSGNSVPLAYRVLSVNKLHNGYRHLILRSLGNQNLGPVSLFVYFDVFYHVLKTQIAAHSALMNPFSCVEKEESFSTVLRNPLVRQDEVEEEDDDYRQAIVGTTRKSREDITAPSPPLSPVGDPFGRKISRAFNRVRKIFDK